MEYQNVYKLSNSNGPPKVNLRQARIADDYGDESCAEMPIHHKVCEDVSREQLDYYADIYPFLEDSDLLFYLYPVAREYTANKPLNCIDSFLYTLDGRIDAIMATLTEDQKEALRDGLRWIWKSGGAAWADWYQCKKLQETISITVAEETEFDSTEI